MFAAKDQYVLIRLIKDIFSECAYSWEVFEASPKKYGAFRTHSENEYTM